MEFGAAFWVGVAFVIFIGALLKPLCKIITEALDKRAAQIRSDLEEAAKLRAQAEALLADYQKKQSEVLDEARAILAHAEEEAKERIKNAEQEIEQMAERKLELAMQRLASTEVAVLKNMRNQAVDIAVETVRALLLNPANQNWQDDISAQSVEQIEKKLN